MRNEFERVYYEWDVRPQPWEDSFEFADAQYYDFKKNPELIYTSLEDFIPLEEYASVQKFYKLLEWINGADSPFESNDSRFTTIGINHQRELVDKDQVRSGTLMFFFRNLKDNLSSDSLYWSRKYQAHEIDGSGFRLKQNIKIKQFVTRSSEELSKFEDDGNTIITLGLAQTEFTDARTFPSLKYGYQFLWRFWIWGDTDREIMRSFNYTVEAMETCLKKLADEFK